MKRRTLLGVWAHPDDETYMTAGLMAAHRRRGDRVVVVMATLGERGTDDPKSWPPQRLAARRLAELRNSLDLLGVHDVRVLGYPDGGCAGIDGEAIVGRHIADVEPDVIVTWGPDGMTGHPDHKAVSRWTTVAWDLMRPQADLWYVTATPDFHRTWGAVNAEVGFFEWQPEPPCTPPAELVHSETLPSDLLDLKMAALQCQSSQTAGLIERLGPRVYREWWSVESFRHAARPHALAEPDERRRAA